MTVLRQNIATGHPERKSRQGYGLKTSTLEYVYLFLKKALETLNLRQSPRSIWVFFMEITAEVIVGLGVLHYHDAFVTWG
jgi:hypothetical protein